MKSGPQSEHQWLQRLVGEWSFTGEAATGPGKPAKTFSGVETWRDIGGIWVIGEGTSAAPDGSGAVSVITLGFDPAKDSFVGSYIFSTAPAHWSYSNGALDAEGKSLTMESEGPNILAKDGSTTRYRDIVTFESDTQRTLSAQMLVGEKWVPLMNIQYQRK